MIKNAREFQITKAQAVKFERALTVADADERSDHASAELERDALRSQLADLRVELDEYQALESGRLKVVEVEDLSELPRALIQARIAAGLSQREFAVRLGLKEQQVQRYEATEYASASLSRILEVVRALGVKLHQDVVLPSADMTLETLLTKLRSFGFDRDFAQSRLVVDDVDDATQTAWKTANVVGRVLGVSAAELFSGNAVPIALNNASASALFKLPAHANEPKFRAYATYARYLATRALACTKVSPFDELPSHPLEVHRAIVERYGSLSFEAALRYVWSLGIPVLPLRDSGAFHGAFWRIGGRPVIVLKQQVTSTARWLIDLLHEYYHAVQTNGLMEAQVIEMSDSPYERRTSPAEREATQWATAVALRGREQELAEMCVAEARQDVPRLKRIVPIVAVREGVSVDVLANYIAYRLALFAEADWWGTASNLQISEEYPWTTARDIFLENVELHRLDRIDRELFGRALSEVEN